MEIDKLKEFIEFMEENNLCELEIEEEGRRVKLKKNVAGQPVAVPPVLSSAPQASPVQENTVDIKSPMVGTFYRAPSPGVKPYVEVGEVIKPGDVVCIIEAMKLMNEIKAEVGGEIMQIPMDNGEPVEFGQTLLVIKPL